jgi:hypothetical protein
MNPRKSLTFGAYRRGEGTKKQRGSFETQLVKLFAEAVEALGDASATMRVIAAAGGVAVRPEDDILSLASRVPDAAQAAPAFEIAQRLSEARKSARAQRHVFRAAGAKGGKKADSLNKNRAGLTAKQAERKRKYLELIAANDAMPLHTLAAQQDCSPAAVRESLKAAGLTVSTKRKGN